jgi:hypothetical protein
MPKHEVLSRRQLLADSSKAFATSFLCDAKAENHPWLQLKSSGVLIEVDSDLGLVVRSRNGRLLWRTSQRLKPEFSAALANAPDYAPRLPLAAASRRVISKFTEHRYRGYRIQLGAFPSFDVELALLLAVDPTKDELLLEIEQNGGRDRVRQISHFYRIEKPIADGGYMVLPHGSGYLIPASMAQELTGNGIIGYRYTLPLFGMVKDRDAFYQIIETYWDCDVGAEHVPGQHSSIDLNWLPSLGELRYPRRFLWRFAQGMDYVEMAKAYRSYARAQGLVHTLEEKSRELPTIHRYVAGIEYRWPGWNGVDEQQVLQDIRRFRKHDLNVNFFFPKWSSVGYPGEDGYSPDAGWQAFLRVKPIREGWQALAELANQARSAGAVVKLMINPNLNIEGAPGYDPSRTPVRDLDKKGGFPQLSLYYAAEVTKEALNNVLSVGLKPDALYFDGYSAHSGHGEDVSMRHPVSRRRGFENQTLSFRETRDCGIIPGAELPRFWSVGECAFFFFDTGWSADLLPVGEPVPLFQLVFRDCYTGCFSGGGYGRYDWPRNRNPRLYELLLGTGPGYNWMLSYVGNFPGLGLQGGVPIQEWYSDRMTNRLRWLQRWSTFYRAIAYAEMTSHKFLNPEWTHQSVQFANGVSAEFDMAKGLCRVKGVPSFSGKWEPPQDGAL